MGDLGKRKPQLPINSAHHMEQQDEVSLLTEILEYGLSIRLRSIQIQKDHGS